MASSVDVAHGWHRGTRPFWGRYRPFFNTYFNNTQKPIDPSCPATKFERPSSVSFNSEDDDLCMENVNELVDWYQDGYQSYLDTEEDICNWMQLILSAMRIKGVQLVDNRDFLEYMRTQVNNLTLGAFGFGGEELSLDAGDLPEDLKEHLLSSYGASSLDTVE